MVVWLICQFVDWLRFQLKGEYTSETENYKGDN
jgi:hypothetical protein